MKLINLTNLIKMSTYTLTMFNTGQVTLPKLWREKWGTKHFLAKETDKGLLIEPIDEKKNDDVVYYENEKEFGIYCKNGLPVDKIINAINEIHGSD